MESGMVIVVPTDFSSLSMQALEPALRLVGNGAIHVLHVVDQSLADGLDDAVFARITEGLLTEARKNMVGLEPRLAGRPHQMVVRVGMPASIIVSYARDVGADMIVMATHGRHGAERAFLGSTTEGVVSNAHCPVLSVPESAMAARSVLQPSAMAS